MRPLIYKRAEEPSSRQAARTLIHQTGGRNPHLRTGGWNPHLWMGSGTLIYGQAAGTLIHGRAAGTLIHGRAAGTLIHGRAAGTLIHGRAAEPSSTDRQRNPHLWTGSGTLIHQMGGWNPHLRTGGRNPGPRPGGRSPIYRTAGWPEEADEGSTSRGLHGLRLSPEPLCARHTALSEAGTRLLCRGAPRVRGHTEGPLRVSGSGAVAAAREPAVEPQRRAPDGLCRDGDTSEGHPGSCRSRQPTLRLCSQTALTLTPRAPHSRAVWGC